MYRSILKANNLNIFAPDTAIDITSMENIKVFQHVSQNPVYLKNLIRREPGDEFYTYKGPCLLFSCSGFDAIHIHLKKDINVSCYVDYRRAIIDPEHNVYSTSSQRITMGKNIYNYDLDIGIIKPSASSLKEKPTYMLFDFSSTSKSDYESIFLNDESCIYLK